MRPVRIGIGGPVGCGKTALVDRLCRNLRDALEMAVVTNDIYTREDAEFLVRAGSLAPQRIVAVETVGCPHAAIREDVSMNLQAIESLEREFPRLYLVLMQSGGDNLTATFSPDLVDVQIYVVDVAGGCVGRVHAMLERRARSAAQHSPFDPAGEERERGTPAWPRRMRTTRQLVRPSSQRSQGTNYECWSPGWPIRRRRRRRPQV